MTLPKRFPLSLQAGSGDNTGLLAVIVNFRTPGLTIDCLRSLSGDFGPEAGRRAAVLENGSSDRSAEQIRDAIQAQGWSAWASVLALESNAGFASANNVAIRAALRSPHAPAYFWLLNSDTTLRPGALSALLEFMEQHPQVGIAGTRLEYPDGAAQGSAFRFQNIWSELDSGLRLGIFSRLVSRRVVALPLSETARRVDWVAGASMLVRREVFQSAGLLDEKFFMYFEEVDLCLRAARSGWECWYVPQSRVVHLVGQSSGVTDTRRPPARMPRYWFDSRRRYFLKNHGGTYAALADAAHSLGFALWRVRRLIQSKPDTDPPRLLGDFVRNSVFVRGLKVE